MSEATNESMEDILHSIRDIIADDNKDESAEAEAPEEAAEEDDEEDDVLELTDVVGGGSSNMDDVEFIAEEAPEEAPTETPDEAPEEAPEPQEPTPASEPPQKTPTPQEVPKTPAERLVSETTAAVSSDAIRQLVQNIPRPHIESPVLRNGNTVEDLVVETLKPMLSEWLDQNLATIVEEIVTREIRKLLPSE